MDKLRVDKWLWAARFFKTRARAKQAIDGGKVKIDGDRAKPSREIQPGDELVIRQGWDEKTVVVRALSDKRGGAPIAALLYEETQASIEAREMAAAQRKAASTMQAAHTGRPTKRDRRQIHRFRDMNEVDG